MELKWLEYAKKLQSIAQAGITYSKNKYELERFEQIRDISIQILQNYTDIEHAKIRNLFANETGYQTPKIDVRGAIYKDNKILLVKEKNDGRWALPGGWADIDTSLSEAIIKEAKEEAGLVVLPKRIISIFDYKKHAAKPLPYGVYKIFVECELIKGSFKNNIETSESGFFEPESLPPLSLNRNTREQIELCFETRKKQCHEAIFD
ncbi:ADP-ribose pyrophosphatase YjhB (NUDIX family) [Scopulibacillus darangshiensis]|uniref:ADP-ribose pyrophosphatase YjhB (NUDIX family) n=1 Tax=Scopulibacillus darangshiensis TaxID=442528 RepID=A0A4R2NHJ9_9BACL|nr:NUDIX hydrolase [Scopulibacillus darangshiensis]TCP20790.1 ADP-ribose pyrophosphatase YjhB (NUDIX family) [Scopulibacillus darangshiensis]